ncbi:Aste57867_15903 [Aphanomyces stellatus]|uniref:Aste57867_15903 protein n=1 Tax=Aphanomyces stellatus TaxID=120398 RepID=A0A485L462_9STRA|nr:hypothetical protein As57867_015847 [Aphanomyces stellatus]VFT92689.1 Aste57867_15903 [Aphanomyces stellatus]
MDIFHTKIESSRANATDALEVAKVEVDLMEPAQFDTTLAFEKAFQVYQRTTKQKFQPIRSTLATKANDLEIAKGDDAQEQPSIPTDLIKYSSIVYGCKHGREKKSKKKVSSTTALCEAHMWVRAVFLPSDEKWVVRIERMRPFHNHVLTEARSTTARNSSAESKPARRAEPSIAASKAMAPFKFRQLCRSGKFQSNSAGFSGGFAQANLVILPKEHAFDFLLFCQRNQKPCPLLEVSDPGCVEMKRVAPGSDIRTDLPKYRIFEHGVLTAEVSDIRSYWRDDLVTFLVGCSFSFEEALQNAGLHIRHQDEGKNVPMYRTNIPCDSAGVFSGNVVVSMRPFTPADAILASVITARYPNVHGSPLHVGSPKDIGIANIATPDYGDAVTIRKGEVPVFWACGVTPQNVLLASKPAFAITHAPGHMFITDRRNDAL